MERELQNSDIAIDVKCPECHNHLDVSIEWIYDNGQCVCNKCDEVMLIHRITLVSEKKQNESVETKIDERATKYQVGHTSIDVHNLPDITLSPEQIARNEERIKEYVEQKHRFKDMIEFAKYAGCPDMLSISGILYEIDEYDSKGFYARYVSIAFKREMRLEWDIMYNRYAESPCLNGITLQELGSIRNDYQYKT